MKITVKTHILQSMVSKAMKGVGNNKIVPLTSMMQVEVSNGSLSLLTTDGVNYFKTIQPETGLDDFYVVVMADIFSKLVDKTTTETVTMTMDIANASLTFKGNGTYNIELPLDEEGELVKFPLYVFDTGAATQTINLTTIKNIVSTNGVALSASMEDECYIGYRFTPDYVVSTDTLLINHNAIKTFGVDLLLPAELLKLVCLMTDEKITVQFDDNYRKMLFTSPNYVVYGEQISGIDNYDVAAVMNWVSAEFPSSCTIPKVALLAAIDRIILFMGEYDREGIRLNFGVDGISVSTCSRKNTELIKYQSTSAHRPFECLIHSRLLKTQLTAYGEDALVLHYGSDAALKMTFGRVTQIIALSDDAVETAEDVSNVEN